MLYYQFAVNPDHDHPDYVRLGPRLASIMIRLDDKITVCTARAIQLLAAGHWQIVEIRHARMADAETEFSSDPQLVDLYRQAEQEGLAYSIAMPPAGMRNLREPAHSAA